MSTERRAETPQWILAAVAETVQTQILPQLTEPTARAAAASLLQVLAQLSLSVGWDPAPLNARLHARQGQLQALHALAQAAGHALPAMSIIPAAADTDALTAEQAILACDGYVAGLIPEGDPPAPWLERGLLAYCRAAVQVDLRFMPPSHMGKITRRIGARPTPKESS